MENKAQISQIVENMNRLKNEKTGILHDTNVPLLKELFENSFQSHIKRQSESAENMKNHEEKIERELQERMRLVNGACTTNQNPDQESG